MIDFLNEQWWFALFLLVILFLGNRYLFKLSKKFYEAYAREHMNFPVVGASDPSATKGGRRNPLLAAQNIYPLLSIVLLAVTQWIYGKQVFEFFYGAILLILIYSILANIQNVFQFLGMSKSGNVVGQIEYSHSFTQRMSALSLLSQSVILAIAALATLRPFFWGGAILCLLLGLRDYINAKSFALPR